MKAKREETERGLRAYYASLTSRVPGVGLITVDARTPMGRVEADRHGVRAVPRFHIMDTFRGVYDIPGTAFKDAFTAAQRFAAEHAKAREAALAGDETFAWPGFDLENLMRDIKAARGEKVEDRRGPGGGDGQHGGPPPGTGGGLGAGGGGGGGGGGFFASLFGGGGSGGPGGGQQSAPAGGPSFLFAQRKDASTQGAQASHPLHAPAQPPPSSVSFDHAGHGGGGFASSDAAAGSGVGDATLEGDDAVLAAYGD